MLIATSIELIPVRAQPFLRAEFWQTQFERAEAAVLGGLVQALVIIALFLAARALTFRVVDGLLVPLLSREKEGRPEGRAARVKTLQGLLKSVMNYALIFMAVVALLQGFGIGVGGVIASAGVLGLAVGFGAQKLVRDVISGFFLLLENQYAVGDYVTLGPFSGIVTEMGMRTTQLQDDLGRMCMLSNGDISQVCNHSRGPLVALVDLGVPPSTDLKSLDPVLAGLGKELNGKSALLETEPALEGITFADATKLTIRVKARAARGKRIEAEMALREALIRRLRDAGIAII